MLGIFEQDKAIAALQARVELLEQKNAGLEQALAQVIGSLDQIIDNKVAQKLAEQVQS